MSRKSKDSRLRLLEPLASDFAAFRAAIGMGVTEIGLIREAVRVFIDSRLSKDEELLSRYENERRRLAQEKVQPIRLVKNGDDPN